MKIEVLISCMHEKEASIIERSNIQSDVLVVNQCDEDKVEEFKFFNKKGDSCNAKIIYTTERGLSRSRNMALDNASGDVIIICDDDEVYEDDYVEKITHAYEEHPDADSIMFALHHPSITFPDKSFRIGFREMFWIGSYQITCKLGALKNTNVKFDVSMGSGTGNGGGEENKFVYDLRHKNIRMIYYPYWMASVSQLESQWFKGYTKEWFFDLGWTHKKILGYPLAIVYCFYALKHHRKYYKDNFHSFTVFVLMLKGVFCNK